MKIKHKITDKVLFETNSADLRWANLQGANLQEADLRWADLDFSCLPLWCGGLNFKVDNKLKKQILYHTINLIGKEKFTKKQIEFANKFHRIPEVPKL